MGNTFTKQYYICLICANSFVREISGSLLCNECRINNEFDKLFPDDKYQTLHSYVTFPLYLIMKDKKTMYNIQDTLLPHFYKNVILKMKDLEHHEILGPRWDLIKSILKYMDQSNYLDSCKFKGLYIHSMKTTDILLLTHPDITDHDRVVHLDLDGLVKSLKSKLE
jgi:hypothetical protein